ncbi:MAG: thiamine pyrophosphokinae [Actinomycetota bacterium]|jgi:thiamine pyrophosphokinase|nr:thiamine pyrophosphokinae [Actinomycetota bacterium]
MPGKESVPASIWPVAIVFAGSAPVAPELRERLPDGAGVIAADSGLHVADALGLHVDLLVGDLDSADRSLVDAATASGTTVERHPVEKDATDLELAFDAALARGAHRIVLVDSGGDRLDHQLGNLALLASPALNGVQVEAYAGTARLAVARGGEPAVEIHGPPGSLVTLLATGGPACGIVTEGLRYPLRCEELAPGTTRGVSNELVGGSGAVGLAAGTLLVVQPFGGVQ